MKTRTRPLENWAGEGKKNIQDWFWGKADWKREWKIREQV